MEIKHKSAIPVYLAGAVWIVYSIMFPMYKLVHIIIGAVLFAGTYFLSKKKFPDRIEFVQDAIRYTGVKDIDMAIAEGNKLISQLKKANENIADKDISDKIDILTSITAKIFRHVADHPEQLKDIRKFITYFLPTTIKLLNSYAQVEAAQSDGDNTDTIKAGIEGTMDSIVTAFEKQLDKLHENRALDIDTEIKVFESVLQAENLK